MNMLTITWDFPRGLPLFGELELRWYSLLFALGFILGFRIMLRYFKQEGIPDKVLDQMLVFSVAGTIIGARLGHVFFYDWDYYSQHLGEILKVWKGGLASHGAAVALIIAMYFFGKKLTPYFDGVSDYRRSLWALDRLVITVALAGCFIRLGNWTNSEIYGEIANSPVETVFVENIDEHIYRYYGNDISHVELKPTGEKVDTDSLTYPVYTLQLTFSDALDAPAKQARAVRIAESNISGSLNSQRRDKRNAVVLSDARASINPATGQVEMPILGIPRWPTQIFEALGYLLIWIILRTLFLNENLRYRNGFIFGAFLVLIFAFRFFIEYLKANQSAFEVDMALNRGQQLSIPLVIIGLYYMFGGKTVIKPKGVSTKKD